MTRKTHIRMEWRSDSTEPDVKTGVATFHYREENPRTAKSREVRLDVTFKDFETAFNVNSLLDRAYEEGKIDGMREVSHAVNNVVRQYGV